MIRFGAFFAFWYMVLLTIKINDPQILIGCTLGAIGMAAIDVVESFGLSKIEKEKENDQNEESINQ